MKVVVTGGAGFIGSNFVHHSLEKHPHWQITVLDALTYAGRKENLQDVWNKIEFIKGDIRKKEDVEKAVKSADIVVNFAAESVPKNEFVVIHRQGRIMLRTVEELFEELKKTNKVFRNGKHEIIDVQEKKIKVLSFFNGFGTFLPLKKVIRHWYRGKILRLRQKWGEIFVTPNHSVYDVFGNVVKASTNPELLCVRRVNYYPHEHKFTSNLRVVAEGAGHLRVTLDKLYQGEKLKCLLRLFAAYISEGNTTFNKANGSYTIVISNKNKEWLESLAKDFTTISNGSFNIVRKKDGCYQLQLNSKVLYRMCEKLCGKGAPNKKIPDFVYSLEREYQLLFWETLLKGDGSSKEWKRDKIVEYTTTSRRLAAGLSLLLSLLGEDFTFYIEDHPDTRRNTTYTIRTRLFYNVSTGNRQVIPIEYEGYVYDLEVEGSHNFICGVGNIVAHNTHVDRSILEAGEFILTNVFGTQQVLEACRKFDCKLVHISTDEVYGHILEGSFSEEDRLNPRNPYAASKASADLLCKAYYETYGLDVVITRSTNNYGPYQHPEKFIPKTIIYALLNKPIPVYGLGNNVRDWIYVRDNCEAIELVMLKGKAGETYNIAGKQELKNIDVVKTILNLLNKPESLITFVKDRPGHDLRYSLSIEKIENLGWKPKTAFEEGIKQTIAWYKANEWWWKPLLKGIDLHEKF